MLRGYTELLVPLIQEGVDNGELRQVDATQAALAIGAVVEGTILLKAYNPKIVDLPAQVRMGLDTVMTGLVK
jgi:hypothetical protein